MYVLNTYNISDCTDLSTGPSDHPIFGSNIAHYRSCLRFRPELRTSAEAGSHVPRHSSRRRNSHGHYWFEPCYLCPVESATGLEDAQPAFYYRQCMASRNKYGREYLQSPDVETSGNEYGSALVHWDTT